MIGLSTLIAQETDLGTFEPPAADWGFEVGTSEETAAEAAGTFEKIFSTGLGAITLIAALYFLGVILVAAFSWLSAGGDSGKIEKARDSIVNGVIGLMIIVAAYAVIGVIGSIMGIDVLNPGQMFIQLAPTNP